MRWCRIVLVFFFVLLAGWAFPQENTISVHLNQVRIKKVFEIIEKQTPYIIIYNDQIIDPQQKVSLSVTDQPVENVLRTILEGTGNTWKMYDRQIVIVAEPPAIPARNEILAQKRKIQGLVYADDGEPIPGASVVVKATTLGICTDAQGHFQLEIPGDAEKIVVSFVGMQSREVLLLGRSEFRVMLEKEVLDVDEVIVTALGITRDKKALGYSATEIDGNFVAAAKESNVVNSLSGRVAGLLITQSASGPAGGSRVIIRGNNSITGDNQPLFVVDGIPIDNTGIGSAAGDDTSPFARADYGSGISDINPDDIESISVLKGPNAAALYGSRAGNGVILITTRKASGVRGLGVSFSSFVAFETPLVLPHFQNEYGQGTQGYIPATVDDLKKCGSWGPHFDGSSQLYWNGTMRPYLAQPDNVRNFFRLGSKLVNTITLEGNRENANIRFSYTHNNTGSVLPEAYLHRHNFNLRSQVQLSPGFTLDAKLTYFHQEAKNRPIQGTEGIMAYVYPVPRNLVMDDLKVYQNPNAGQQNSSEDSYRVLSYASSSGNPYWILNHDVNDDARQRFSGFVKVDYHFTNWLSAFARIGTDVIHHKYEIINQYGHHFYSKGRYSFNQLSLSETNADLLVTFDKSLKSKLHLTASLGANHSFRTNESMGIDGENFKIPTRATVNNAVKISPYYVPLIEKIVNSVYGELSFSVDDYLFLDFSARNDWSSTLSAKRRSYFYPSLNGSFLLNKIIDPESRIVNLAKIRASWAQVGNDTQPYQLKPFFELDQDGYLGQIVLTRPDVKFNPDLRTESIISTETGIEWKMLSNRLFGELTLYRIVSKDLIFDVPVPASTSYKAFRQNVGKITNVGMEMMLGGDLLVRNNWKWSMSLNFATNTNRLEELIPDLENFVFSKTNDGSVVVQATVGGEFGDIYGTTWTKTAEGKLVDSANGKPKATAYKVHLGNYQPRWTGGLVSELSYKNMSFRALLDGRIGGQLYSGTDADMDRLGVSPQSLNYRETGIIVNGVVEKNGVYEPNNLRISSQDYYDAFSKIASNYIYDQTNIRLRELTLAYTIPSSWLKKSFLREASIGFTGRNICFLYKKIKNFDPESSFSTSNFSQGFLYYNLPSTRSLGVNLRVSF